MYNMIDKYMQNISLDSVRSFAQKKNIDLSNEELNFTYNFIRKNYQDILKNPKLFNLDRYKDHYNKENFEKIKKVYVEYFSKYQRFL